MTKSGAKPQAMRLTTAAAERICALLAQKGENTWLRIGVKNGGCAGMEYTLNWTETRAPHDELVEDKGAKLLIEAKAILFLLGCEMDYQVSTLKSGFVFNNPNQLSACGCGESVQLAQAAPQMLERLQGGV